MCQVVFVRCGSAKAGEKSFLFGNEEDTVELWADRAFKKMEQMYISYGQKSNAELLLLYGFCLDRNPFNSVEVRSLLVSSTTRRVLVLNLKPAVLIQISVGLKQDEEDDPSGNLFKEKIDFLLASGRGDFRGAGLVFPLYNDR